MSERFIITPENAGKGDPLQTAIDRFEKRVSAPRYNPVALQRALDRVRTVGTRVGTSPGELYATLAGLSGIAVDLAGKMGRDEDQRAFAQRQQEFQQTSEQFTQSGESPQTTSPSQPERLTGIAAG